MGAGQSSNIKQNSFSSDAGKTDLFTMIFIRLLTKTDIVDLTALTKGPGACGDYIVLLEKDLNKEFGKLKLETSSAAVGTKQVQDFLFAKIKDVKSETPSDTLACRELAIFYIRLLQLVGALTMSIFTPPDLVSRIRTRAYKQSINSQKKNIPPTIEQLGEIVAARNRWLSSILQNADSKTPNLRKLTGKDQLKYNTDTKQLIYSDETNNRQYAANMKVDNIETYPVTESFKKSADGYWITLTNPTKTTNNKDIIIFRIFVNKTNNGYIFDNDTTKKDAKSYSKDWTDEIIQNMVSTLTPIQTPSIVQQRPVQNPWNQGHNAYPYNPRGWLGRGGENKPSNAPKISTLPGKFKDTYDIMSKWSNDISTWTEAAPASYRSVLLYVKPNIPGAYSSSYICIDNWANKNLRSIPPFASLESLYFDNNDGTATFTSRQKLNELIKDFKKIYSTGALPTTNSSKTQPSFEDVVIPAPTKEVTDFFCNKKTSQGDVFLNDKLTKILELSQKNTLAAYKRHFDLAYDILNNLFVVTKLSTGENTIKFSDAFTKNSLGARATLEEQITNARGIIAEHYINIETTYYKAIADMITAGFA